VKVGCQERAGPAALVKGAVVSEVRKEAAQRDGIERQLRDMQHVKGRYEITTRTGVACREGTGELAIELIAAAIGQLGGGHCQPVMSHRQSCPEIDVDSHVI